MKKRILKTIGAVAVTAMMTTSSFASVGISDSIKTAHPDNHIYSGYLITGITSSGTNSKPIAIGLSDDQLIPTKDGIKVKQCIMYGDAKGDIATERFEIKVSKIICKASNDKQVKQDITGYVYGADGLNGVKAVLDSKKQVLTVSSGNRVDVLLTSKSMLSIADMGTYESNPIKFSMQWVKSLSIEELKKIDFTKLDYSEFVDELTTRLDQKEAMNSAESYHKEMLIKTFSPEVEEELLSDQKIN